MSVSIRQLGAPDLKALMPQLVSLLLDTVNGGVPLGFLPPVRDEAAERYWAALAPDLEQGTRILLVAERDGRLLGTGQLWLTRVPNGRHRAELQKVLVAGRERGRGIGRLLMQALHQATLDAGRSLIILNTRRGLPAVAFYRDLGYQESGVIPGFTVGPAGERFDTVVMFKHLDAALSDSRSAS
jgi:GNAT superfamily N-acetyltransferase